MESLIGIGEMWEGGGRVIRIYSTHVWNRQRMTWIENGDVYMDCSFIKETPVTTAKGSESSSLPARLPMESCLSVIGGRCLVWVLFWDNMSLYSQFWHLTHCVTQAVFKLTVVLLPHHPRCWDYKHLPLSPAWKWLLNVIFYWYGCFWNSGHHPKTPGLHIIFFKALVIFLSFSYTF